MTTKQIHVAVLMGGLSSEREVSLRSGAACAAALEGQGYRVTRLDVGRDVAAKLAELKPDVCFNALHGRYGEDGCIQGLLETMNIPYTHSGVLASALAMHKERSKPVLAAAGVPVVEYWAGRREEVEADPKAVDAALPGFEGPFFVKPSVGGSSVGVRKVERRDGLAEAVRFALRFDDAVLVERGIAGRELECAVLGGLRLEASAVGEIVPGKDFYDYEDKYHSDAAKLFAPADLPEATSDRLRGLAVEAFRALGGTGMARVDFLLEGDDRPYVNEINTLPGFTAISMYPKLWQVSGVPLPELVSRLVELALERHRERRRLDEGIKDFLAALG